MLNLGPALGAEFLLGKRSAVDEGLAGKYCHGLTVSAESTGAGHLALLHAELGGESFLQTGAVKSGKGGELVGLETRVDESRKGGHIGRVEDDNDVLDIGAVFTDVVTELGGNLAVALEQILAGHALLTGSAA